MGVQVYSDFARDADRCIRTGVPFTYQIARSDFASRTPVRVLGYNGDVDNVREDLWTYGGEYANHVSLTTSGLTIASSSAADAAAGTGARTIDIHYLDENFVEGQETVTLDGVNNVPTVAQNIIRVNDVHVMSVGTGLVAAGNITVTHDMSGSILGHVPAGSNASRTAHFTVPAGKTLYITDFQGGVGNQSGNRMAEFTLRSTTSHGDELTPGVFHFDDIIVIQDGNAHITFPMPIKVVGQADVKISVISDNSNANAICAGHFSGWLETN